MSTFQQEAFDFTSPERNCLLHFPGLPEFPVGACKRYIESGDTVFAMAAEEIVDGIDLDECWSQDHVSICNPRNWTSLDL